MQMVLTDLHASGSGNSVEDEALAYHLEASRATQAVFKVCLHLAMLLFLNPQKLT
jgi:hypothetical protein